MNRVLREDFDYCHACVRALIETWQVFMHKHPTELVSPVRYGKPPSWTIPADTLGLDAVTEVSIARALKEYCRRFILVTEEYWQKDKERGNAFWRYLTHPLSQPRVFFCDPTDRSAQLKEFIELLFANSPDKDLRFGELMCDPSAKQIWEERYGGPVSITGATSSLTCVVDGEIWFTVILNMVAGSIFVACDAGTYYMPLPQYDSVELSEIGFEEVIQPENYLRFPSLAERGATPDDALRFVAFFGKKGYAENFAKSGIMPPRDVEKYLYYPFPGGPARPLYLSSLLDKTIGFVESNGEKIEEFMAWLAMVKFARSSRNTPALTAVELIVDQPLQKGGVLTSPPLSLSMFQEGPETGKRGYINLARIWDTNPPSSYRATLVVTPSDNRHIGSTLEAHTERNLEGMF